MQNWPTLDRLKTIFQNVIDTRKVSRGGDFIDRINELLEQQKNQGPGYPISKEAIIAQGSVFFAAGFETTSNTLSTFTYNLAKHPEIQVRGIL